MAIMYALTGFSESSKGIAELCWWSRSYLSVSSDCDVGDGSLCFQVWYNVSWGAEVAITLAVGDEGLPFTVYMIS